MQHKGHRLRLKERFAREGLDHFSEHEVLELLLFYAIPQGDVNGLSHSLIETFGSLGEVLEADPALLRNEPGIGDHTATLLNLIPALFRYYCSHRYREKPLLAKTADAIAYCENMYHGLRNEQLHMLCLNLSHRLIRTVVIQKGTVDRVAISLRDVAQQAMSCQTKSIILSHNHPGGVAEPSEADIEVTHAIIQTLLPFNIEVIDHIIVAEGKGISMKRSYSLDEYQPSLPRPSVEDASNKVRSWKKPGNIK